MGHELAAVLRQHAQEIELDRRQVDQLAGARDAAVGNVDHDVADRDRRLGRGVGRAAQDGAQARCQLLAAERLRHVVVGAGVERTDLLALVADGGDDDDRHAAPLAHLAADVDAAAVRQHEVEQDGVRRAVRERVERLLLRRRRVHLEARVLQHHAQSPDYLRLVVHDQDASSLGHVSRR